MKRRIMITGASGALGRVFINYLRKKSSDLFLFTPGRSNSDFQLDLLDRDQIRIVINRIRPDIVIHLAASFSNDFEEAYAINVAASRFLLEEVEAANRNIRVVLVGSAAEYGAVTPEESPIRECHVLRPVSVYGITKAWQTELAYLFANRGSDVVVARIFNLIGPHLSERLFIGRIHKQIDEIFRGQRMKIEVGPLSAIRDYLSIEEAASQLLAISDSGKTGLVYHIASGRPIRMRELLVAELAAHGLDESIIVEKPVFSNRTGYDVPVIYADISRISTLLKIK